MSDNRNLIRAQRDRFDEFFTRLSDIEDELRFYPQYLMGKAIYCPCDDPFDSQFVRYFVTHFNELRLARLDATNYGAAPTSAGRAMKLSVTVVPEGVTDVRALAEVTDNSLVDLEGDGDFSSPECVRVLDACDVVVTNPPFSKWRMLFALLRQHKKDFILLGTINAATYSEVIPRIIDGNVRLGVSLKGGKSLWFVVPDDTIIRTPLFKTDANGHRMISLGAIRWLTSFPVARQVNTLELTKRYDPVAYPKYDNCNAIEVGKVKDIPIDYAGTMGVPVTFLDWYDPDSQPYLAIDGVMRDAMVGGAKKYTRLKLRTKASSVFTPLKKF